MSACARKYVTLFFVMNEWMNIERGMVPRNDVTVQAHAEPDGRASGAVLKQ